jgi:alanine dehydrogenase
MSRIAGRLAPLIAASLLMNDSGGAGVLLPGVDAIAPARIVIVGAGNVGSEASQIALALGASVTVFARKRAARPAARAFEGVAGERLSTALSDPETLAAAIAEADVLIGAVLEPGRLSPKLVSRAMLRAMRAGSVFIDVGIDHGGIGETSRMTSISAPTFVAEGVLHYCVANMPALVARTARWRWRKRRFPACTGLPRRTSRPRCAATPACAPGCKSGMARLCTQALPSTSASARTVAIVLARANELQYKTALQGIWETSCGYSDSPAGPAAARRR